MAKRRMLSQNIIYDENLNSTSIEAQWLFNRLLIITDDCGVVPASFYSLKSMCNLPDKIYGKLQKLLEELIQVKLIQGFVYEDKRFFCFKKDTFDDYQAFIIKNRTRSEYLKMDKDSYLEFYNSLQEITINYSNFFDNESYHIESKELIVKGKELKAKSKEAKNLIDVLLDLFKQKYLKNKNVIYVESKQDTKYLGMLLGKMKKQFPEYNTEEMTKLFEVLFDKCTAITDDNFLNQITISFLNSQLNKYLNYIKNGKTSMSKGFGFQGTDIDKYKRIFEKIKDK